MKPLFLLLLGLTLLVPATHAQDDDAKYDEYADEMEIMRSLSIEGWAHAPALPVHASTSKGPTIADFARAFLKQKRYSSSFSRAILARLDGLHPKPDDGMFRYLIDVPHGYLFVDTPFSCGADCTISLEMCYWHTANDHRLVGLTWGDRGIGCLLFYDYNPQTRLMTPLPEPPIKGFYDNPAMLNAHLPRQGKDIHIKPIWDNPSDTLTLRWNGSDAFIFDGAAERYRQPVPNQPTTCDFLALFKPEVTTGGEPVDLYDAPDGKVIRHLTDKELDYDLRVKRAENGWAYVDYGNNLLGAGSSEGSAWVRCTSLYVLPAGPVYTNYLYAEPTRASHRVATFNEAQDNSSDIWWKVLEIRKGWVKIRTTHLGITGWIEARILCGSKGVDC